MTIIIIILVTVFISTLLIFALISTNNTKNSLDFMQNDPKLSVELIPMTSWYSNVRSNVTSKQWDIIRKDTYKKANYKCEICGGKGMTHSVECHEIWDYDEKTKLQKLVRFIALCPNCHKVKHIGLHGVENNINWLASING